MKRWCVQLAGVLCAVVVCALGAMLIVGEGTARDGRRPSRVSSRESESALCGPNSLHIALSRLGVPVERKRVISACRATPTGTTLGRLAKVAGELGCATRLCRMTWKELLDTRTTCILFVRGNHFLCADASERAEGSGKDEQRRRIRVYEVDRVAAWWSRGDLEREWRGESLVLMGPEWSRPETQGPRIAWSTCWEDCGFVYPAVKSVDYQFLYRNAGTEKLTVEAVDSSCGCTLAEPSATELAPGEEAKLRVSVDIRGKRGPFREYVLVRTNDAHSGLTAIRVCGGVYPTIVSSVDTLYFGRLKQGERAVERFFVHDPGTGNLRILQSQCRLPSGRASCGRCSLDVKRIPADSPLIGERGRYPVEAGDYAIDVTLCVEPDCPVGRMSGDVLLRTNLSGHLAAIRVGVDATVRTDIEPTPGALLITRSLAEASDSIAPVPVQLARPRGRTLETGRIWISGRVPCRATFSRFVGDQAVELLISHTSVAQTDLPVTGRLHCVFKDGASIEIPVVVALQRRAPPRGADPLIHGETE